MKISLLMFVSACLISVSAFGVQSEYLHDPIVSTRIEGMGGAYTAVADDYNALFFNPAGLARRTDGEINLAIQAGGTPQIVNFVNDLSAAGSNPNNIQSTLTNYFGDDFGARVSMGGTWVRPNWGIAIMPVNLTIQASVNGTAGVSAGVQAYQDSLIQFGYAWNLTDDKRLSFGIAPKAVYRAYYEKDLSILDFVSSSQIFRPQDAEEGLTLDTDLGFLYTVPDDLFSWLKYAKPTFGLAVRNLVAEGFTSNLHLYGSQTSLDVDAPLERALDVGSNFELPEFWVFKPHAMLDFHDIGTRYASFVKCSHVGVELLWQAFGWLKGSYSLGLSEGYITAGVSAKLWIFLLDLATYADDVGTNGTPIQSRNYMIRLNADF